MTQLLSESPTRFLAFRAEDPARPIRLRLAQDGRHIALVIAETSLELEIRASATPEGEIGITQKIPKARGNPRYVIGLVERMTGGPVLLVTLDEEILASASSPIGPENIALSGENVLFDECAWDALKVAGHVSAPHGAVPGSRARQSSGRRLVLVSAPRGLALEISAALQDHAEDTLDALRLFGEPSEPEVIAGGDAAQRVRAALREAGALPRVLAQDYDEVNLVVVQNERLAEVDEIVEAIATSPPISTVVVSGGYTQRVPSDRVASIELDPEPFAIADDPTETATVTFGPKALPREATPALREALNTLRDAIARKAERTFFNSPGAPALNSAFERVNRFWTIVGDPAAGDAFELPWMLRTFFGFGGAPENEATRALRRAVEGCARQGIAVLGAHVGPAPETVDYLVDGRLLRLAYDATFARGLRPFDAWVKAFAPARTRLLRMDRNGRRLAFLHLDEPETTALAPGLLERVADALSTHAAQPSITGTEARPEPLAGDPRDLAFLVSVLGSLGRRGQQRLDQPRILRLISAHPGAVTAIAEHGLEVSGPSAVAGVIACINSVASDLSEEDARATIRAAISARVFPRIAPHLQLKAAELGSDLRLSAAMQLMERSIGPLPNAGAALQRLRLDEHRKNFFLLVNHLKEGDISGALAFGRGVLRDGLAPRHRADVLAVALFSGDVGEARSLLDEMPEPLAETDRLFFDAWEDLLSGGMTPDRRQKLTGRILESDPAYEDLKVVGRHYREIADFDSPSDPERDVICVITAKNEASRIGDILDHHARLGVRHFILIDNMSSDGTVEIAREMGAKVIQTAESYRKSRYGMAWVNDVLDRHCTGHWTLVIDADEMLVYPGMETVDLRAFAAGLEAEGFEAMSTILLDMYPPEPISGLARLPRGHLRETYNLFDAGNLTFWPRLRSPLMGISGGVRDRLFRIGRFAKLAPIAHTKTPFVRWQRGMKYLTSTHDITPVRTPPCFGILEHYKYTPDFVLRAKREVLRREHWDGGSEYAAYASVLETEPDLSFIDPAVTRARGAVMDQIAAVSPYRWPASLIPGEKG